jgi:hypothetical protein
VGADKNNAFHRGFLMNQSTYGGQKAERFIKKQPAGVTRHLRDFNFDNTDGTGTTEIYSKSINIFKAF